MPFLCFSYRKIYFQEKEFYVESGILRRQVDRSLRYKKIWK